MRGSWTLVVVLAGCDLAYGLDRSTCTRDGVVSNHDEDEDGIQDACDLCPHLASNDEANEDGDGLGDQCDPDPTTAQCIAAFEPFERLPPGSFNTVGVWEVERDRLVHRTAIAVHELIEIEGTFVEPTIQLTGRFTSIEDRAVDQPMVAGVYSAIERLVGVEGIAIGAITELVEQPASEIVLHAVRVRAGEPNGGAFVIETETSTSLETSVLQGTEFRLEHAQGAATIGGSAVIEDNRASTQIDSPPVAGTIGIRAYNAAFEIGYVLVIEACAP
ncbi:MAG: hypothetical protein ACKV2T_07250 [Kofleriaceae bacterium]